MSNSAENRTILHSILNLKPKENLSKKGKREEEGNKGKGKLAEKSTGVKQKNPQDNMMTLLSSEKVTCLDVQEVERTFKTDVNAGLTNEEATQRRKTYGTNEFDAGEDDPLWKKFLNQV